MTLLPGMRLWGEMGAHTMSSPAPKIRSLVQSGPKGGDRGARRRRHSNPTKTVGFSLEEGQKL